MKQQEFYFRGKCSFWCYFLVELEVQQEMLWQIDRRKVHSSFFVKIGCTWEKLIFVTSNITYVADASVVKSTVSSKVKQSHMQAQSSENCMKGLVFHISF